MLGKYTVMPREEFKSIWQLVIAKLKENYSQTTLNLWFADVECVEMTES